MESHLTALAKTVAQISLELRSIKSLEDIICDLRRDVQEMRDQNVGYLRSGGGGGGSRDVDMHKSISEPNVHQAALSSTNAIRSSQRRKQEFQREKDKMRSCVPSYTNPRKLKKLTK